MSRRRRSFQPKLDDNGVKMYDLNIGETNNAAGSLIAMEMQDTETTGFSRRPSRKKSIDRIFSKMNQVTVEANVDTSKLAGLPRRSLTGAFDISMFRDMSESDDENETDVQPDGKSVKMLDLKIGEQDPTTNSLVALEMQDTEKTGFKRKNVRKKSIDRIFGKMSNVHILTNVDKSKLKGLPRRSLTGNLNLSSLRDLSESDGEDDSVLKPDDNSVKLLDLKIGEQNPETNSLVCLEMKDTHKTGFRRKNARRESIDRIFGKVKSVSFVPNIDTTKLKGMPRRSLCGKFDLDSIRDISDSESDDENTPPKPTNENVVQLLDLKIGEQDPETNALVALEMNDTNKTGYKQKTAKRKKSINRIFGKVNNLELENVVDREKLKDLPRRSLCGGEDLKAICGATTESDDETK